MLYWVLLSPIWEPRGPRRVTGGLPMSAVLFPGAVTARCHRNQGYESRGGEDAAS
jgi:hypothetical protein